MDVDLATQRNIRRTLEVKALCQRLLVAWEGHPFDVTALEPQNWVFSFRVVHTGRLVFAEDEDRVTDFVERPSRPSPASARS